MVKSGGYPYGGGDGEIREKSVSGSWGHRKMTSTNGGKERGSKKPGGRLPSLKGTNTLGKGVSKISKGSAGGQRRAC